MPGPTHANGDWDEAAAGRMALRIAVATGLLLAIVLTAVFFAARAARPASTEPNARPESPRADRVEPRPPSASPTSRPDARPNDPSASKPAPRGPESAPATPRPATTKPAREPQPASRPADSAPATSPWPRTPSPTPATSPSARADDDEVRLRLDGLLFPSVETDYRLGDREAGAALLEEIRANLADAQLSRETWARMAILAVLLDRPVEAEQFAARAKAAGRGGEADLPTAYQELSVRFSLGRGKLTDALVAARRLMQATRGAPRARLLMAEVQAAQQNIAAMLETTAELGDGRGLPAADRLRMGRLWLASEQWERLRALLSVDEAVPEALEAQRDFLRAVLLVQDEKYPEALALLDYLLQRQPEDYDVRTWRGAALLLAGRKQEAVAALAHAEKFPARPEAWHWRGVAALRMGDDGAARRYFQTALTASPRYGPSWEALAAIALNEGELQSALQNLENAVQAGTRRGSVHLLLAITHARLGNRDEMVRALRAALTLDPRLAETAKQAAAIVKLIDPAEIEALAASDSASQPATESAPTAGPPQEP